MNCEGISELFAAYLDNEVTPEEKSRVENHLSACDKCREELKVLGATQNSLRQVLKSTAEEIEPSPRAWDAVRERIATADSFWGRLSEFLNSPGLRMAVPVAVLVLLAAGLMWHAGIFSSPAMAPPPSPIAQAPMPPTTTPTTTSPTTPSPSPTPASSQPAATTPPAPSPTTPPVPAAPPPAVAPAPTPPYAATPPPVVNVAPSQVTVQPPNVTVNPPQVTVQPPPPASYPGPIVVVSVSGPLEPIYHGEPRIEITLKNISSEPVANLTAILELNKPFQFVFSVLLAPGESTSARLLLIGGEFSNNKNYPLTITGYYQSIERINYINYAIPVQITPPAVTVQAPPPAQVVSAPSTPMIPGYMFLFLLLPIGLGIALILVLVWPKKKR